MSKPTNVSKVNQLSVFRYPGGKTWFVPALRTWLKSLSKKPRLLMEPFGGGGIVSLTAVSEQLVSKALIVEKDPAVSTVWKVCLSQGANQLAERIRGFRISSETIIEEIQNLRESADEINQALSVILLNRIRRGGVMADGAGVLKFGENGNGLLSRWYPETLAKRVEEISGLREKIQFIEGDGMKEISSRLHHKSVATFADPPYVEAGRRLYNCWEFDHKSFLDVISKSDGPFLITYDDSRKIKRLARAASLDWRRISMRTTGHSIKRELLISNDLAWVSTI